MDIKDKVLRLLARFYFGPSLQRLMIGVQG